MPNLLNWKNGSNKLYERVHCGTTKVLNLRIHLLTVKDSKLEMIYTTHRIKEWDFLSRWLCEKLTTTVNEERLAFDFGHRSTLLWAAVLPNNECKRMTLSGLLIILEYQC